MSRCEPPEASEAQTHAGPLVPLHVLGVRPAQSGEERVPHGVALPFHEGVREVPRELVVQLLRNVLEDDETPRKLRKARMAAM